MSRYSRIVFRSSVVLYLLYFGARFLFDTTKIQCLLYFSSSAFIFLISWVLLFSRTFPVSTSIAYFCFLYVNVMSAVFVVGVCMRFFGVQA